MLLSVLAAAAALAAPVPHGDFLVTDLSGAMRVVDTRGRTVRRLSWTLPRQQPQALELARDRRHAYISLWREDLSPELFLVDLADGSRTKLDDGTSPALSPDGTRLAYVAARRDNDITYRTALVIRDARTGRGRTIPLTPKAALGTPPELVLNWSPDGQRVALLGRSRIRIVDVRHDRTVDAGPPPLSTPALAPVFLTRKTLVVLMGCCVGPQRLTAVDAHLRTRYAFARVSSPVEQVRRVRTGELVVVTALAELALVTRGHSHVIARRVVAVAP